MTSKRPKVCFLSLPSILKNTKSKRKKKQVMPSLVLIVSILILTCVDCVCMVQASAVSWQKKIRDWMVVLIVPNKVALP